uniref:Uncharacterized protein n=1 Tax=Heliothis virescens TaxID=7102 RepID=A0A2A4JN63_HELVI
MSLGGGQNTEGSNAGGIFVQFNQDCTSLVAGSSSGYHLFALTPDDGIEEIYASRSGQETCLVDRLFSSSLVAVVTVSAPRKLIVCHYKKGTEICNYSYSNTILAVKLNRSRLIVCLEESLHIHNIRDMKILHTIRDTPPNPRGLCALSPCVDHCHVAYPGSSAVGEVQIFDAVHLNAKCVISAHDSPLAALAWSMCGRRLATASERGTVIRVFAVPERTRLYEFRRGVKRCVSIACLAFSACGAYLAATSNTETVHVAVSAGAGYLPAQVADVLAQGRAVARAPRLLVATAQGVLYVYALDAAEGGDCALLRQHQFLEGPATGAAPQEAAALSTSNSYAGALRGRDPLRMTGTALPPLPVPPSPESPAGDEPTASRVVCGAAARAAVTGWPRVTESERAAELGAALETPARGPFDLRDPKHFPPMRGEPAAR